ncbi:hypothetical protein M422DRAFT_267750 [Sphaerobolus stellatus SS14]|uniref:Unplaced genomic scaffold SPHSTscaffold_181, whole genome shotgun sequence n=1 Tax=Sphaerobolus stellatus (strain SS14) TaxID=990650 RepID=A0A0C9UZ68_SPHS4|nr:hypothetical protein M422DRAFT_267750 [Sphaerobolus stellatus SS14]
MLQLFNLINLIGIVYRKKQSFQQVLTKPEHDILSLQDHLRAAFDLLECLSDKAADSWCWPSQKNTNIPHPRAVATHTRIEALLLADNLNISLNDAAKHIKEHLEEDGEEVHVDVIQEEEEEEEEEDHSEEESDHFNNESEIVKMSS